MKRILYFFIASLIISGCTKSAFVADFDQSPQDRMATSVSLVSNTLVGASNGWIATLPTAAGGGFAFYMTFDNQQNVSMYADLKDDASIASATSTYRVKTGLGADLIFDTYNYISLLADPTSSAFGGTQPTGFKSDVEFTYVRSTTDSIIFIGKQFRQPLKMVKATATQKLAYTTGGYKTAINKVKDYFNVVKFPYIEVSSGTTVLKVAFNLNTTTTLGTGKRSALTGVLIDGVSTASSTGKFAFTLSGADFVGDDFVYQGITFVRLAWKDATTLALYDATGKEYVLKSSPTPLTPLTLLFGYPTTFTYRKITIPGTGLPTGVTSGFTSVYNSMLSLFAASGRTVNYTTIALTSNSTLQVYIMYTSNSSGLSFVASADYAYTRTGDVITLSASPALNNNWVTRAIQVKPLADYMLTGPFKIDWVASTTSSSDLIGGLYRTADMNSFIYGLL